MIPFAPFPFSRILSLLEDSQLHPFGTERKHRSLSRSSTNPRWDRLNFLVHVQIYGNELSGVINDRNLAPVSRLVPSSQEIEPDCWLGFHEKLSEVLAASNGRSSWLILNAVITRLTTRPVTSHAYIDSNSEPIVNDAGDFEK